MKKILFIIIFICSFISCSDNETSSNNDDLNIQLTQCIPSGLQTNLIAFYPFNSGSLDDVSNSNDLTNLTSASPAMDRNGNIDCAYKFEFTNGEYLTTNNTYFLNNLSEFSISLWFKMDVDSPGGYSVLISRDESTSTPCDVFGQWSLGLYDIDYPTFGLMGSVWDLYDWQGSTDIIDFDQWHHLVATYKTTDNALAIYRDGILRDSSTGICDLPAAPTYQDIGDLFIGKFYDGKIDDIAIFNISLNQSQVTEMFEMETCCL
ncbi:MAG: LamG domain-containing protein [Gelidibacter sp.]